MNIKSLVRNLFLPERVLVRAFTKENLECIESRIALCEETNSAQIVFAYQVHKKLVDILKNTSSREIALRQFKQLSVWDTETNSGILFYLLLADRQFEIVADRGIAKIIPQEKWDELSNKISELLKSLPPNEAVIRGLDLIAEQVGLALPVEHRVKNELGDKPIKVS